METFDGNSTEAGHLAQIPLGASNSITSTLAINIYEVKLLPMEILLP